MVYKVIACLDRKTGDVYGAHCVCVAGYVEMLEINVTAELPVKVCQYNLVFESRMNVKNI